MVHYIRNVNDNELFWNNEYGWVDFSTADIFFTYEVETLRLPIDGEWVIGDLTEIELDSIYWRTYYEV
jgi:hypothetical protein